jgi:hypothetical protein
LKVVLRGECEEKVDGFGISRRSEAVTKGVAPLFVAEGDQTRFVLGRVAERVYFDLEVDLGGENLVTAACGRVDGDLRA